MPSEFFIVSIGDRVQPGVYQLHSRFDRVINFFPEPKPSGETGESKPSPLISIVDESIGDGPCNVVGGQVLGAINQAMETAHDKIFVEQDRVVVAERAFSTRGIPRYSSELHQTDVIAPQAWRTRIRVLEDALVEAAPPKSLAFMLEPARASGFNTRLEKAMMKRFVEASVLLKAGASEQALSGVRGLGWGLTPSGDDFIAGYSMAFRLLGKRLPWNSHWLPSEKKSLSDALLALTLEGRFCWRWKELLLMLAGPKDTDADKLRASLQRILEIGSTSGADTAVGLLMGLKLESERKTHAS